jgi:hypothetical protein
MPTFGNSGDAYDFRFLRQPPRPSARAGEIDTLDDERELCGLDGDERAVGRERRGKSTALETFGPHR